MLSVVNSVLIVFVIILFVTNDRSLKISILIISSMLFSVAKVPYLPNGIASPKYVFPLCYFLSELHNIKKDYKECKKSSVFKIFEILIILTLFTIIVSPHLWNFHNLRSYLQSSLFSQYLAFFLAFVSIRNDRDMEKVLRYSFVGIFALFILGLINFVEGRCDYLTRITAGTQSLGEKTAIGEYYSLATRFRVQATFSLACTYGCVNIAYFFMYLYGGVKNLINKKITFLAISFSLFGIFMCGFRSLIACIILALAFYWMFAFKSNAKMKYLLIFIVVSSILYLNVPTIRDRVDSTINVASDVKGDEDISGSSIEMRTIQFLAVCDHIRGRELIGRGWGYFNIDLGWDDNYSKDGRLFGLEGIHLEYLLERGIIGLGLLLFFLFCIFKKFYRNQELDRQVVSCGMAILVGWFVFSFTTGEQSTFYPCFLILGLFLRLSNELEEGRPIE